MTSNGADAAKAEAEMQIAFQERDRWVRAYYDMMQKSSALTGELVMLRDEIERLRSIVRGLALDVPYQYDGQADFQGNGECYWCGQFVAEGGPHGPECEWERVQKEEEL